MAIPAHPSVDRPRSASAPAHSRRAPESNNGNGHRSQAAGSIDQSPSVQRLRAMAGMMNPPTPVAQSKTRGEEGLAASISQSSRVQALKAMSEMMNAPAPVAQTKQMGPGILISRGLSPAVTQLKWIAGARPGLLMWDKLVDGAQWYYTSDGRMFYARGNYISDVLPRQGWLEMGASELEDADGEIVDVRAQPPARSKEEALQQPWRIVIREAPSAKAFTEAAECFNKEWGAKPAPKRSEKGKYECSGDDWTQIHEGVDVSEDLVKHPEYSKPEVLEGGFPSQYVAFYAGGDTPIALMVLEERQELPNWTEPSAPHLYIRWLVGSPDRRGGGGALVEYAKIVSRLQGLAKAVSVESAKSAVGWYEDQGYRQVAPSTHEHRDQPCKCVYLAWPPEAAVRMHEEHTKLLAESEARKKAKKGGSENEAEKSGSDEDD